MGFKADPKRAGQYISFDGNWRAKATVNKQEIFNQDGWRFSYMRRHLEVITSPTNRQLVFLRSSDALQSVRIRERVTGDSRVLLQFRYAGNIVLFLQKCGSDSQVWLLPGRQ
jgi:hypothetical protein